MHLQKAYYDHPVEIMKIMSRLECLSRGSGLCVTVRPVPSAYAVQAGISTSLVDPKQLSEKTAH